MCNESLTNTAVSLHVYSPPFKMCQTFNEKTGGRAKSNMTFYSKFGKKISFKRHVSLLIFTSNNIKYSTFFQHYIFTYIYIYIYKHFSRSLIFWYKSLCINVSKKTTSTFKYEKLIKK